MTVPIEGLYPSFSSSDSQVPLVDSEETDTAYLKQLTLEIFKKISPRHLSKFTSVAPSTRSCFDILGGCGVIAKPA